MRERLHIPRGGVSDAATFQDQRLHTVPLSAMRNVVLFNRDKKRPVGGTRWGVRKAFPTQMGGGRPVQAMLAAEALSAQTGLIPVNCTTPGGESREAGPLTGHAFVLNRQMSMLRNFTDSRAGTNGAFNAAWHPTDPDLCVAASIFTDGGYALTGLTMYDVSDGSVVWEAKTEDKDTPAGAEGTTPQFGNNVWVTELYTYCAAREWVYVFKTADGAFVRRYPCNGWSSEAMWVGVDPDGAVIVGFWGTGAAGTLPNQAIAQDVHASSFSRSGFGRYSVVSDIADPLRWDPFPAELATTAPWYESAHGYVRLSEHLARAPRGCIPYAFAVGPDGEIAVGMTNQGWAWNTDNPPDGTSAYTTLALFSAEGVLLWERDTQSLRRPYVVGPTTYYNDIPTSGSPVGTPNPSVNAVCFDALGNIYAGGEPNDNGDGVFKFDFDGNLLWKAKVGALVEQHAMAIDPTDGNLWVCVLRNTAWAGAEGRAAQLLKLASRDGSVLAYFDLSEAGCDPFQVAVNSRGDVLFVSDYVS